MSWLEIIELRTSLNNYKTAKQTIDQLLVDLNKDNRIIKFVSYQHLTLQTDFSIHIIHKSTPMKKTGSDVAVSIVSCLKPYGYVSHNIWLKAKFKNKEDNL